MDLTVGCGGHNICWFLEPPGGEQCLATSGKFFWSGTEPATQHGTLDLPTLEL